MITLINIDLLITKLQLDIDKAKGATFVTTKTALLEMAIRGLEQQATELAIFREQQGRMQAAVIEALEVVE